MDPNQMMAQALMGQGGQQPNALGAPGGNPQMQVPGMPGSQPPGMLGSQPPGMPVPPPNMLNMMANNIGLAGKPVNAPGFVPGALGMDSGHPGSY